ncbi:hypothetical protein [Planomicrobium sp. CPCC 101110]|uniref:hypothetical protein n=1 Tax=Planomicrobium sp. CPCC 101110 TaxID=2599619 RepID=UPI001645EAC4|nr:hypothetical protein [Planomicrobium sp. CPCC 101110]
MLQLLKQLGKEKGRGIGKRTGAWRTNRHLTTEEIRSIGNQAKAKQPFRNLEWLSDAL